MIFADHDPIHKCFYRRYVSEHLLQCSVYWIAVSVLNILVCVVDCLLKGTSDVFSVLEMGYFNSAVPGILFLQTLDPRLKLSVEIGALNWLSKSVVCPWKLRCSIPDAWICVFDNWVLFHVWLMKLWQIFMMEQWGSWNRDPNKLALHFR